MSRQIFVSYTRDDEVFVKRLVDDLSQSGANVWLDIRNARPGRHWTRSIEQALSESSMMIVVLSPAALESSHVAVEWQAYLEAYRPVVPAMIRPCDPPGPLRTRRPVDFTREASYHRAFHELSTRLIEYGTRIRRSDPVIWTLSGDVNTYRDERSVRPVPRATVQGDEFNSSGLRRMVQGLREILRRDETVAG
jgi:hypothetical protein